MPHDELSRANALASALQAATAGFRPAYHLVPQNRDEERTALLTAHRAGNRYEPTFTFAPVPSGPAAGLSRLAHDTEDATDSWGALVHRHAIEQLALLAALTSHAAHDVTAVSILRYGPLDPERLADADTVVALPPPPPVPAEVLGIATLASILEAVLARLALADWKVALDSHLAARLAVSPSARRVKLRPDAKVAPAELERLVLHELGCHALRAVAGARQPCALLGVGLAGYLATEEGLAVHLERAHGLADPATERRYALRTIAVAAALSGSFYDTFTVLLEHLVPTEAFDLTLRVKRGIAEGATPGAYVKDKLYLEGAAQVGAHLATSPDDIELLLGGKLGLESLDLARALVAEDSWQTPTHTPEDVLAALAALR